MTTTFTPAESAQIEHVLEVGGYAYVNPMFGGAVAVEARTARAQVETLLRPLGFGVSWDNVGNYGAIVRLEEI